MITITAIIGDIHIIESKIKELLDIFSFIILKLQKYKKENLRIVVLGDLFTRKHPTPLEVYYITCFMSRLKDIAQDVIVIEGNHDTLSDDFVSTKYLEFLGEDTRIEVLTDFYDESGNYYAHRFTDKSERTDGKDVLSVDELTKNCNYTFLGHQHTPQNITDKIFHVGSIYYVSFGENEYEKKRIGILDENNTLSWIELQPIPICNVFNLNDLALIDPKTKVRITFKTFEQFKNEISGLSKYKDKFVELKIKLDFSNTKKILLSYQPNETAGSIKQRWLTNIPDLEIQKILTQLFEEHYD